MRLTRPGIAFGEPPCGVPVYPAGTAARAALEAKTNGNAAITTLRNTLFVTFVAIIIFGSFSAGSAQALCWVAYHTFFRIARCACSAVIAAPRVRFLRRELCLMKQRSERLRPGTSALVLGVGSPLLR